MKEQHRWSIKNMTPTGSACEVHPWSFCQGCKGSLPILLVIIQGVFSQENQTAHIFCSIGKLAVAAITLDLKWP